ncbi:MAG TPA: NAD-dependent epimerase/dehydratase family protein [Acidimicrobiales bacterium]|nr:NAD-dependent epimerase/dehydratase family protein [Acidimicrobiales bacterium]
MSVAVITGSAGLIGSEAARYFGDLGLHVVGVDNDMRRHFFGPESSTADSVERLRATLGQNYDHRDLDIRDRAGIEDLFRFFGRQVSLVIHTAAQPSHDWAAREPFTDFDINAVGTLNVVESMRRNCPEAPLIFTSTNKVYGDTPNRLPLVEEELRWEIDPAHTYAGGIREDMAIDHSLHSLFGASKVAADVVVQEYGRYFDMPTACFRGGTLTGPHHAAAELHGFLAYVMRCAMSETPYTVFGYGGKQVRDAIHSHDLVRAFHEVFKAPRAGEVYNIGGGRDSNCSVLEAIVAAERISGRQMRWSYQDQHRIGDHQWWIGDNGRFQSHYPGWHLRYGIDDILQEIHTENLHRWTP